MSSPYYSRIEVKIVDKPYYAEGDIYYPSTAIVSFFDEKNRFIGAEDYGYLTTNQLYDQIDATGGINIEHCYLHNFSITTFRRTPLLHKEDILKLSFHKARRAMFQFDSTI